MIDKELKEATIKELEEKYFLVPQKHLFFFLGGSFIFGFLLIFGTYRAAISAVETTGAKIAINEINKYKEEAKNDKAEIDAFARRIKNGKLREELIKYLKSDQDFLVRIKGDRGDKGEQGVPGTKGDSGVSTWEHGQYTTLNNSSQKRAVWLGSSSVNTGLIVVYDELGNEAVKIGNGGLFIWRNNGWVEPYIRK